MGLDLLHGADALQYNYELKLGGELYAEVSRSGLNTLPVDDHAAYALMGCTIDGVRLDGIEEPQKPFGAEPDEIAKQIVKQGSVALIRNDCLDPTTLERSGVDANPDCFTFLADLDLTALREDLSLQQRATHPPFSSRQFAQCFYSDVDGQHQKVTRVYTRGESGWSVIDYTGWGTAEQKKIAESVDRITAQPSPLPLDAVIVQPGGLGVLYKAQLGYRAVEGILARAERLKNAANSKMLIAGPIVDPDEAGREMRRDDRDVVFVPEGTVADRVVTTADIQKLLDELKIQMQLYFARVHLVHATDKTHITDQRTAWQMGPMKNYINTVRQQIARVVRAVGAKTITFPDIQLESIDDISSRYKLLTEAATAGWLDRDTAKSQIALLVA